MRDSPISYNFGTSLNVHHSKEQAVCFDTDNMLGTDIATFCMQEAPVPALPDLFTDPTFSQDYTTMEEAPSSELSWLASANDPTLFLLACDSSPSSAHFAHPFEFGSAALSPSPSTNLANPARLDYTSFLAGAEVPVHLDDTFWAQILDHSAQAEAASNNHAY